MSKISYISTIDNEQIAPQSDLDRQVYKQKRLLRQKQAEKREFQTFSRQLALLHYASSDQSLSFTKFYRAFKKEYRQAIEEQIKEHQQKLREAKSAATHDPQLFDLNELRREQTKLQRRLAKYNSDKVVKIGKKNIPASIYAHKKAFNLHQCSTLVIRKEYEGAQKLMYRNACRDRACPVCGHYHAKKTAEEIIKSLKARLIASKVDELKKGRLVHIVLTVQNVPLYKVLDIKKAWRNIQKNKNRVYKRKTNPHEVWQHLPWGFWKFEVTRNAERGDYHPHLHILAWVDGWLATSPKRTNRVFYDEMKNLRKIHYPLNDAQKNKMEERKNKGKGWWTQLQKSWRQACKDVGLVAHVNGSRAIKGAKTQHVGGVLWFTKEDIDNKLANLDELLQGSTKEIGKYVSKQSDLMQIDNDDELIEFLAKMHGQQIMDGFGGMKIKQPKDEEETTEEVDVKNAEEVVYRFDFRTKTYVEVARYEWNSAAFKQFTLDLQNYLLKPDILAAYEHSYRRSLERGGEGCA